MLSPYKQSGSEIDLKQFLLSFLCTVNSFNSCSLRTCSLRPGWRHWELFPPHQTENLGHSAQHRWRRKWRAACGPKQAGRVHLQSARNPLLPISLSGIVGTQVPKSHGTPPTQILQTCQVYRSRTQLKSQFPILAHRETWACPREAVRAALGCGSGPGNSLRQVFLRCSQDWEPPRQEGSQMFMLLFQRWKGKETGGNNHTDD